MTKCLPHCIETIQGRKRKKKKKGAAKILLFVFIVICEKYISKLQQQNCRCVLLVRLVFILLIMGIIVIKKETISFSLSLWTKSLFQKHTMRMKIWMCVIYI